MLGFCWYTCIAVNGSRYTPVDMGLVLSDVSCLHRWSAFQFLSVVMSGGAVYLHSTHHTYLN